VSTSPSPVETFLDRAGLVTPYGIRVFPLPSRSKDANLPRFPERATADQAQIDTWQKENPNSNCAALADDENWMFDVDDLAVFERVKSDTGHDLAEIDTLVVRSSGAKRHFYFKHDDCSRAMGNRDCDLNGKEVFSVRGHNKYVVSPGSIHPDTGEKYEIIKKPTFGDIPTAPDWLTDWIMRQVSQPQNAKTAEINDVILEGNRDNRLFAKACELRDSRQSKAATLVMLRALNCEFCQPPMPDSVVAQKVESAFSRPPRGEMIIEEPSDTTPANLVPEYPMETIDGDLIGELTRALTGGTFIPPQFIRENIKVALGVTLDGFVGYPNHEDLHLREFLHNVSTFPQSGKGESYKRVIAEGTGFLFDLLKKTGVSIVDGGTFGSGEFMVKVLQSAPTHRMIARFDEMSEVWTKTRVAGCILEKKFLTLFESTAVAQGSFKNGVHAGTDFHYAHIGDFTKDSFDASFIGSGSRGSGYLSRCVFQFAEKQAWEGDWLDIDTAKVERILSDIESRLIEIVNHDGRVVPAESDEAQKMRLEFFKWLDLQDSRYTPRLKDHLKRDALLRATFSGSAPVEGMFSGTITAEMMRRSIDWCRNQLENRIALFPEDAGSAVEIMERQILKRLADGKQASERDLKRACHVERAGSGGFEVFNRAVRSLMFSHEIRVVGKTRKGMSVYEAAE
jgi:Bifunctional DNA primase/polymerase, N-terminal/Primase C terminal 1 (PriCT-1)